MIHQSLYLRLLQEWAFLDAMPGSQARVRKCRIGCIVLRLERLYRVRTCQY